MGPNGTSGDKRGDQVRLPDGICLGSDCDALFHQARPRFFVAQSPENKWP